MWVSGAPTRVLIRARWRVGHHAGAPLGGDPQNSALRDFERSSSSPAQRREPQEDLCHRDPLGKTGNTEVRARGDRIEGELGNDHQNESEWARDKQCVADPAPSRKTARSETVTSFG